MQNQRLLRCNRFKKHFKTAKSGRQTAGSHLAIDSRHRSKPATCRTAERLIAEYDRHIDQGCGFSVSTRRMRKNYACQLLKWRYGSRRADLLQLTSKDLAGFVTSRMPDLSPGSIHTLIVSLRCFCRFLEFSGKVRTRLSGSLPRVATAPSHQPPKTLGFEELQRFLKRFPRTTPVEMRDYAIAVCLSKLALRSHEAVALTVDDIDWRARTLRLSQTKQRRERLLFMPDELSAALAIYLEQGRPHTKGRVLFVNHNPPVGRSLDTRFVRDMISRAFTRCGIAASGTHILRHTWATYAHRRGASLKLIADFLGHSSLQTTTRYAHVNVEELRQAALPWPKIKK